MTMKNLAASVMLICASGSVAAQSSTDAQQTGRFLTNYGIAKRLVNHTFSFHNQIFPPPFDHTAVYLSPQGMMIVKRQISYSELGRGGRTYNYHLNANRLCIEVGDKNLCAWIRDMGNDHYRFIGTFHGDPVDRGAIASLIEGDELGMVADYNRSEKDRKYSAVFEKALAAIVIAGGAAIIAGSVLGDDPSSPPIEDKPHNSLDVCRGANPAILPYCLGYNQ